MGSDFAPTLRVGIRFLYQNLGYVVKVIIIGITSVEPHLDLTKTQLLFVSIR